MKVLRLLFGLCSLLASQKAQPSPAPVLEQDKPSLTEQAKQAAHDAKELLT